MPADGGIGAPNKRREDVRFLTGKGKYTDDLNRPGQTHVIFVRSQVAHGTLTAVNTDAAAAMPGVIRIFTGADFAEVGGIPCGWQVTDRNGEADAGTGRIRCWPRARCAMWATRLPPWWPRRAASGARTPPRRSRSTMEELPAVVDMKAALADGAPKVHDDLTSNLCYDWGFVEENKDGGGRSLFGGRPCDHAGSGQQPPGGQPDGAAGGGRAITTRAIRAIRRCTQPARTPM